MYELDHVGLSVGDLEAMVSWYCETLGLKRNFAFDIPPVGLKGEFVVSEEGWAIEMLQKTGSQPGPNAPDPNTALMNQGFGHVCLRVPDVDAYFDKLIAAGAEVRMAPQDSPEPGVRMAFVADPEGNLIEFHNRAHAIGAH